MKKIPCIAILILFFLLSIFPANADAEPDEIMPLTFAMAGDLAIANSADLRHSRATQVLMEKSWRWGARAYFPQINLSASENDRLQQLGADSFTKNYGISLEQLIFDGGRTRQSRKLQKLELNLSSAKLDRTASEIGEAAISAYRSVLSSRAVLEIKIRALVVLEEQRRILSEEVALGLALPVDLANAEINLSDAKLGIYSLELDLIEAEKQFAEILGLHALPDLAEKVDVNRSITLPQAEAVAELAKEKNPDLADARFSISKREAELKFASNLWLPTLKLQGGFNVSGPEYPLTRYNWSLGINIEFATSWIQNRTGFQLGWEPPYDRTAVLQNNFTPLPDPASGTGKRQARLALELEKENYNIILKRIGRVAANAIEKCSFAEQRRILALQAVDLGIERCQVEEVRLELGQITRLDLMEAYIEQTQREIVAVEAAAALLEAEHELEKFLDLRPGELGAFASGNLTFEKPQRRKK